MINLTLSRDHCAFLDRVFLLSTRFDSHLSAGANLTFEFEYQKLKIYQATETNLLLCNLTDSFFMNFESEHSFFSAQINSFCIGGMKQLQISVNQSEMIFRYEFENQNEFTKIISLLHCDSINPPVPVFKYQISSNILSNLSPVNTSINIKYNKMEIKQKNEIIEKVITEKISDGCNLQIYLESKDMKHIKRIHEIFRGFYDINTFNIAISDDDPMLIEFLDDEIMLQFFCSVEVEQLFIDQNQID